MSFGFILHWKGSSRTLVFSSRVNFPIHKYFKLKYFKKYEIGNKMSNECRVFITCKKNRVLRWNNISNCRSQSIQFKSKLKMDGRKRKFNKNPYEKASFLSKTLFWYVSMLFEYFCCASVIVLNCVYKLAYTFAETWS
jgi:hypothetical protein